MAWLEGWDKRRIKFTVDKDKIDTADLQWFRVIVTLSSTQMVKVFAELTSDANRFKIAFTKADGETQLYGEIERWDTANQKVIIHVSRDGWVISNTEDTDFYMYYDKDHADNTDYISSIGIVFDAGSAAIDRTNRQLGNITYIELANPADFTGKITNVAIFAVSGWDMVSAKVATFRAVDATHYTAISVTGNLGAVAGGSVKNFAVNLDITAGDFIGIYFTAADAAIELSLTGGVGIASLAGDQTACSNAAFTVTANWAISLYGATTAVGVNVWDTNSKMVQHMVDATTSTIKDSTSNNNTGTKKGAGEPASATGKVGLGQDFDGTDDFITMGNVLPFEYNQPFTLSCCLKNSETGSSNIISKQQNSGSYIGYGLGTAADGKLTFFIYNGKGFINDFPSTYSDTLYHIVVTYDGSNTNAGILLYVNGELVEKTVVLNVPLTATILTTVAFQLSGRVGANNVWDGLMDEVHVDNIVRSAGWIKAEYNNLFDTLLTYGSEETEGTILEFFETLSIVDTKTTSGTLAKAETLSIVDTKITSGSLGFIETLSIVDSWSSLLTFFETLSIVDSKFLTGTLDLTETLGIVDSATFQCIKTFYETLSIIDTITTSGSLNLAETLSIVDSWGGLLTFFETLSITDTVAMGGSLNVSEIISIIDSFIRWIEHPIYTEPAKSNPIYTKPAKSNPIYTEPTKGHPVYTEPTKKIKLD